MFEEMLYYLWTRLDASFSSSLSELFYFTPHIQELIQCTVCTVYNIHVL